MNPVPFFQTTDMDFLTKWQGKLYDKSNDSHKQAGARISQKLWEPTKYWAEVVADRMGMTVEVETRWLHRGGKKGGGTGALFQPYTWAKLFFPEDEGKEVFYTVGLDVTPKPILLFKLHYRFSGGSLTDSQKEKAEYFIQKHQGSWYSIPITDLNQWNWDKLIDTTVHHFQKHLPLYQELITLLHRKRIARVCWNSNNWERPSGSKGKSTLEGAFEQKNGFGMEEWLFDLRHLDNDGFHYGFLQPINRHWKKHQGKTYDISLWTINSEDNQRYWLGELTGVEVLTESEARTITEHYRAKGWLDERLSDLRNNGIQIDSLEGFAEVNELFNVRIQPESVSQLGELEAISADDPRIPSNRYILVHWPKEVPIQQEDFRGIQGSNKKGGKRKLKKKAIRRTQNREFEIELLHNEISMKLEKWLIGRFGKKRVIAEGQVASGSVDMILQHGDSHVFFEIKTYAKLLTSLRMALGQVLEYAYYPDQILAERFVLVGQWKPGEKFLAYLKHLKNALQIELDYVWFDVKRDKVGFSTFDWEELE